MLHYTVQAFDTSGLPVGELVQFTDLAAAEALGYGLWRMKLPGMARIDVMLITNDGKPPHHEATFRIEGAR